MGTELNTSKCRMCAGTGMICADAGEDSHVCHACLGDGRSRKGRTHARGQRAAAGLQSGASDTCRNDVLIALCVLSAQGKQTPTMEQVAEASGWPGVACSRALGDLRRARCVMAGTGEVELTPLGREFGAAVAQARIAHYTKAKGMDFD